MGAQAAREARVVTATAIAADRAGRGAPTSEDLVAAIRDHAIFTFDLDGRVTSWNPGAEAIFGWSRDAFVGLPVERFFTPEDLASGLHRRVRSAAARSGRFTHEHWMCRRDGSRFFASGTTHCIADPSGFPRAFVTIVRDQTTAHLVAREREALLDAERAARARAERADHMKDEFLATLSHELRTPLNAVLGWAQILGRSAPPDSQIQRGLQIIERNARAQAELIGDLLETNRILSGKVHLDIAPVEIPSVIHAAIVSLKPRAESKGVVLEATVAPDLPVIRGDSSRLQQVLWNLLSNAVKFTSQGGHVRVCAWLEGESVCIAVADTGQGIAPECLPRLFDRYRQTGGPKASGRGLGLGLALVKQLVELHGGSVRAESAGVGLGATFTVRLPLEAPGTGEESLRRGHVDRATPAPDRDLLAGTRVLAVDDDEDTRELVRRVLEEFGASVSSAASGPEALEVFVVGEFDVLVSDISMAPMNGYELIRAIREHEAPDGRRLPALAVTALARDEDRARARQAGFQACVSKPVDPYELVRMVRMTVDCASREG
nr:MAG: histidine kinase [Pseudomonadota bacterium]